MTDTRVCILGFTMAVGGLLAVLYATAIGAADAAYVPLRDIGSSLMFVGIAAELLGLGLGKKVA